VEGNSIKWRGDASPMNWGDLIGAGGLIKELAEGFLGLRRRWPNRNVAVRLQMNRPPSLETHPKRVVDSRKRFYHPLHAAGIEDFVFHNLRHPSPCIQ